MLLFFLGTALVYGLGAVFLGQAATHFLKNEHRHEMLRRVGYSTGILEWLPTTSTLTENEWSEIVGNAPFVIKALSLTESDERTMSATDDHPYVAYQYSDVLQSVIFLEELFNGDIDYGCAHEVNVIAVCFVFMTIAIQIIMLYAANLVAYWFPRRVWASRTLVFLSIFASIGMGAGMVITLTDAVATSSLLVWQDDVRRTAELVASIYSVMDHLYPSAFPILLFVNTLAKLNAQFVTPGLYSLHFIQRDEHSILPPLLPSQKEIASTLLLGRAADPRFTEYFPESHEMVGTKQMTTLSAILAVVHNYEGELPTVRGEHTQRALQLVLIPQAVLCLVMVLVFPYASLGKHQVVSEYWHSPWSWRLPSNWPYRKGFHAMLLVIFTTALLSLYVAKLSSFYKETTFVFTNIRALITGGIDLAKVGTSLLSNYAGLLQTADWNTSWLQFVNGVTSQNATKVNQFYQSLFNTLHNYEYTGSSVAEAAALLPQERLPLLMNHNEVAELLRHIESLDTKTKTSEFLSLIRAYDLLMLYYLLCAMPTEIRHGSTDFQALLEKSAADLDPQNGATSMNGIIRATLINTASYADMAERWRLQTIGPGDVKALFDSEVGQAVVLLESQSVLDEKARWPDALKDDSPYLFAHVTICDYIALGVLFIGLAAIVDYLHAAWFFAQSSGSRDGAGSGRTVLSNDYTAPRQLLPVNHHHLWLSLRRSAGATGAIMLLCFLAIIICAATVRNVVDQVLLERIYSDTVTAPTITDAKAAGMMELTAAAWLRAFLMGSADGVASATQVSNSWTLLAETEWTGSLPSSLTSTGLEESFRDVLRSTASTVSALSTAQAGTSVYDDFIQLLQKYHEHFPILELYECLPPADFAIVMEEMEQFLLLFLYSRFGTTYTEHIYQNLQSVFDGNSTCLTPGDQQIFFLYMRRLEAVGRRNEYFPPRQRLAERMRQAADLANAEAIREVRQISVAQEFANLPRSAIMWAPIFLGWLSAPLVYVVYRTTQQMHLSIYYY